MNDQLIIELFKKRSEEAIAAVSRKYGNLCKTISHRILRNEQDSEECVNDTYLVLWNTIPPQEPNPLVAYVCKIVRNLTLKKYRYNTAEKRNSIYDVTLDELEECIEGGVDPEKVLEEKELTGQLNAFAGKLKEKDRVIFVKRYWFGEDIPEIAEEMGLTSNYINVHLHRIREKLKQFMAENSREQ